MIWLATFVGNPFFLAALAVVAIRLVRRRKGSRKNTVVVFNVVAALVILAAFDAALVTQRFQFFRIESPDYHHGLRAGVTTSEYWGEESYPFYTNSLGMRDAAARTVPLLAAARRYLFLGDSFAEGIGVEYERTFAGIIDRRLRASAEELLNGSVISYSPKLYYHKVRTLLERGLEFEELYLFIDISDVQDEVAYSKWEPVDSPAGRLLFRSRAYFYKKSYFMRMLLESFRSDETDSELWGGAENYYPSRDRWLFSRRDFDRWGARGLDSARYYVEQLAELCRTHEVRLTVSVHPWPSQVYSRTVNSEQNRFWKEFAAERELGFIDLFPLFINEQAPEAILEAYYLDDELHWNAHGHRLVADRVWSVIEDTR